MEQIKLASIKECTGCKACIVACKKNAISFVDNETTLHMYPKINISICVNCNRCVQSCPVLNFEAISKTKDDYVPKTYCGWHIDNKIRLQSTSGGVGSALAQTAITNGYCVIGAKFDNQWNLVHDIARTESELAQFVGSKYLLSDTGLALEEALAILNQGGKIFYIGTPCQCESIKRLVNPRHVQNLLTCSIICHGVNSPKVWHDFVQYIETKSHSKLKKYNFRSKKLGWGKLFINYSFANEKQIEQKARNNLFHVWFGQHYNQRLSCFNCKFRTIDRYTDFIIGDFWGIERIFPNLETSKGVSVLIVNSDRADLFIKLSNNLELIETDQWSTYSVLKGFTESQFSENKAREIEANLQFAKDYKEYTFEHMSELYPTPKLRDVLLDFLCSKFKSKNNG